MSFTVVIPARFASSRLPGKPLADIGGKPMIRHVYEQACRSRAGRVLVATDDDRILEACNSFGAEAVMTSPGHVSGTDRLQEVVRILGLEDSARIVNVQGDEPLIPPALIDQVAEALDRYPDAGIATLCERIERPADLFNPNVVKVVRDAEGYAHYFSRAPVPWFRDQWQPGQVPSALPDDYIAWRHIGIYGYRASLLNRFVSWEPAPTETIESLEQLRALYQGVRIHVSEAAQTPPAGVDTAADLERVRQQLAR
ncbi:3-deoxy-manno-octulosonate cytidylyltransferase (CMP-KDO synthetase) [Marinobacter daqiaonensis]|uniref:3-deoxy-manno-octulosonate cytidylyltransferase n=1 Tax=Marinobacter daqiaonensis TaxID=650891 RepID=A0A1I6H1L2_9GAMM|nr:3-deoxy-manno-octulosonate cytidylyltransferase [Marinobacter daqiaonensis]SFR48365.1 3-deoxy-manno-octulosonate cytidylyltransferase (CMP-KDO synthetase) [Marinobacter daqiaonensis]